MHEMKNTARSLVRIGFDGLVYKEFRGGLAKERFEQEVRALKFLEEKGCSFVPRLLEADEAGLKIVTTNCGNRVERVSREKLTELFGELEGFGVRHEDPEARNVTYRPTDGRFCVIDFEFATIIENGVETSSLKPSAAQ
jgi:tRNA A-37 threonylcarbamoyl transferase component Bud32